jgi:uncharacterized protein (DUF433 family)
MSQEYVEKRDGGYYLAGSRVSLDSIVHSFLDGASPESILQSFPSLSLEQIYGTITFYLAHREEVEAYLDETAKLWESARQHQDAASAQLQERLARARQETHSRQT